MQPRRKALHVPSRESHCLHADTLACFSRLRTVLHLGHLGVCVLTRGHVCSRRAGGGGSQGGRAGCGGAGRTHAGGSA